MGEQAFLGVVLLRMVEQLADTFHGRGDYINSNIIALGIRRDDKIAWSFRVVT